MKRRTVLGLLGSGLVGATLPAWTLGRSALATVMPCLFFDPDDVPRIRANARTPLLQPTFAAWRETPLSTVEQAIAQLAETQDTLTDLATVLGHMRTQSLVYLVTREAALRDVVTSALRTVLAMPKWDFMLEGGKEVIGLQRASLATVSLLFTREALGEALDQELRAALPENIAEKGCVPCYRTLQGMAHPGEVQGWSFDEQHRDRYDIDMSRWPEILGGNNLKAIPVMGLGVGALALEGEDERAAEWLQRAVASAREYLSLYAADGSYFEGTSYVNYALRSLFLFLEAHYRTHGTIDWIDEMNFYGLSEHLVAMQAGRKPDGTPDVVNFSDSRGSVYPAVTAWIARHGHDRLAQYATEHFAEPGLFADFLWYRPDLPATPPPPALKNVRFDLDWIVVRTGWAPDDSVLAFRSGEPGNHEHADRNSFLLKAYGERLLTDPFDAAYDWRQPGWALRLTAAHNAVLIDGEGHQYHSGEEGTNASQAAARVVRYVDNDEVVWWSSDATPAYQLVMPDVQKVMRSLLFVKPGTVVVFDQIEKKQNASAVAVRFHPDNRDGHAVLQVGAEGRFQIRRPNAVLYAQSAANVGLGVEPGQLDLPEEVGLYPFAEVKTEPAQRVEIVTVLVAQPGAGSGKRPAVVVEQVDRRWEVAVDGRRALINVTGPLPELAWS